MLCNQARITPATPPATANQFERLLVAFETQQQQIERMAEMLLSQNDMLVSVNDNLVSQSDMIRALSKNNGGGNTTEKEGGSGVNVNAQSFFDTLLPGLPESLDNDGVLTNNIGGSTNNVASHLPQSSDLLPGAPPQTTDPPHQSLLPGPNAEPSKTNIDYRLLVTITQRQYEQRRVQVLLN